MPHLQKRVEWVFGATIVCAICWMVANLTFAPAWPPAFISLPFASLLALGLLGLLIFAPTHYAILATGLLAWLPTDPAFQQEPNVPAAIALGLLAMRLGPANWRKRKAFTRGSQWALALTAAWLVWTLIAALGSDTVGKSLTQAACFAAIVIGGLTAGHSLLDKTQDQAKWLSIATLSLASIAIWTWMRFGSLAKAAPSPFWQDANFLSAALALLLPLLLYALRETLRQQAKLYSLALGLVILLFLGAILRFNSRGAWLSLGIAAAIFPILAFGAVKQKFWGLLALLVVGLGLAWGLPRLSQSAPDSPLLMRVQSIGDPQDFSNRERLMRWRCALRMTVDAPILGHGPGQFGPLFKDYLRGPQEVAQIAYWFGWKWGAHNDALTTLAETGIPGLLLFLGSLLAWAMHLARPPSSLLRPLSLALITALLTWLVHAQVNDLLSNACLTAWVFVILGGSLGTEKT